MNTIRFQLQVSIIPSVVRQVQPYLERISRPPWRLNLREDHMVNETMGCGSNAGNSCRPLDDAAAAELVRWPQFTRGMECDLSVDGCCIHPAGGVFASTKVDPRLGCRPEMILKFMSRVFGGLRVMLIEYYMSAYFAILLCCYIFLYTIYLYLHLIIYIWFISPGLFWIFFSTKIVSFAQVQWRYYDLPGRSSLYWTLMLIQQAVKHRGRKKPLEERPFLGIWYGSTQRSNWYIWYMIFWSDTTTSSKTPEIPCKTWWIYSIS